MTETESHEFIGWYEGYHAHDQERSDFSARLSRIKEIIEAVDNRCAACDGPVTPTLKEMTQDEISAIYALSCGMLETWKPT